MRNTSRRAALCAAALGLFALLTPLGAPDAFAQPVVPPPVPSLWTALGVKAWPAASPLLGLEFNDIVVPGTVVLHARSRLPFTQTLLLYSRQTGAPETLREIGKFTLDARTPPKQQLRFEAKQTQDIILLAQTPDGWFMVERQLKVGRAAPNPP